MMFIGGEEGIQELLPKIASFKESQEYKEGQVEWLVSPEVPDELFGVSYRAAHVGQGRSILVNPSDKEVQFTIPTWMKSAKFESIVGVTSAKDGKVVLNAHSAAIISHSEG
jgi:hypothetical protein